jgi:hypothetical protein
MTVRWRSDFILGWIVLPMSIIGLIAAIAIPPPQGSSLSRARAKCDEAVQAMLTTDDLVELQRSTFLIERLNCSVQRRLP